MIADEREEPGGFAALDPDRASLGSQPTPPAEPPTPRVPEQPAPVVPYYQPPPYAGAYGGFGVPAPVGYPGGYPGYPVQPKTNGLAVASMIVSIVGALSIFCYGFGGLPGLVGAVLGHVARRQIRRTHDSGDGMALAGIIVGWISVAISVAFLAIIVVLITVAVRSTPPDPVPYDNIGGGLNAVDLVVEAVRGPPRSAS